MGGGEVGGHKKPHANSKDITGHRFGRLVAVRDVGTSGERGRLWVCQCDCGIRKTIPKSYLVFYTSCGCVQREAARRVCVNKTKHGLNVSRLNNIRRGMISRCYSENNISYENYGALGVTVCEEWRASIVAFASWAMSNGYDPKKTIDRKNPAGNYTPDNCQWATPKEQGLNKRDTKFVTIFGIRKPLATWAEDIGIRPSGLKYRLLNNWPDEELISPKDHHRKRAA